MRRIIKGLALDAAKCMLKNFFYAKAFSWVCRKIFRSFSVATFRVSDRMRQTKELFLTDMGSTHKSLSVRISDRISVGILYVVEKFTKMCASFFHFILDEARSFA